MHHTARSSVDEAMDRAARRVMTGTERPYDIASDAMAGVHALEDYRGPAYTIWAEITDFYDDPHGPNRKVSATTSPVKCLSPGWKRGRSPMRPWTGSSRTGGSLGREAVPGRRELATPASTQTVLQRRASEAHEGHSPFDP